LIAAGLVLALVALWLPTAPATAATATVDAQRGELRDCFFGLNFVSVPLKNVEDLVPDHYKIRTLESEVATFGLGVEVDNEGGHPEQDP
jgi:hypothetical protein